MKAQFFKRLRSARRIHAWVRSLILVTALVAPLGVSTAHAQTIPAACLDDQGNFHPPANVVSAWTIALNFNHPPSHTTTMGCRITTLHDSPQALDFEPVPCTIHNNVNKVKVGGGSAPFDGNFWIECPPGPAPTGFGPKYNSGYIYGRATFANQGNFTLFQHQDVDADLEIDAKWRLTMRSRYGSTSFDATDTASQQGATSRFNSQVIPDGLHGLGAHFVNGSRIQQPVQVLQFEFDFTKTFTVGGAGEIWTLHELMVDPPPRCCNPN